MLYLFHGPDDFSRAEKIAAFKNALGDATTADLNTSVLEGPSLTLSDIRHHADAMPFLASKRLVIIRNYLTGLAKKAGDLEALIDYVHHLSPTTDLILVEHDTLDQRHPLLTLANEIGEVHFAGLDRKNLHPWIMKRAETLGTAIKPDAANLLGRLVGLELRTLNNELEKLALYVKGERPIEMVDVELLVPYTEEADQFGFANAIGQRNARRAYDQMGKELEEGKNPMAILGGIAAQIRALLEVKDMHERGLSPAEIAQAKGWRSDYAAKARLKEAAKFSMTRLEQILEMLLEIDLAIKTGRMDSVLALDLLIARLCALP